MKGQFDSLGGRYLVPAPRGPRAAGHPSGDGEATARAPETGRSLETGRTGGGATARTGAGATARTGGGSGLDEAALGALDDALTARDPERPGTASTGQTTATGRSAGIGARGMEERARLGGGGGSQWERRAYVAVDLLHHPCLASQRYGTFFNLCRLHGVSFDLQDRVGTVFTLHDSLASGLLGMICVAPLRRLALGTMRDALTFIRRQVGGGRPKSEFDDDVSNFASVQRCVRLLLKEYHDREQRKMASIE
jgi:hypothetical protein